MANNKNCETCHLSYDINKKDVMRCVYHDKYPKKTDCCEKWSKRSDEMINRDMAYMAVADAKTVLLGAVMISHLPKAKAGE